MGRCEKVAIAKASQAYLSGIHSIAVGVSKGSVIGSLLFVIYINLLLHINHLIVRSADDTSIILIKAADFVSQVKVIYILFKVLCCGMQINGLL